MAALIAAQRAEHGIPVAASCRAAEVSRSWYYKWSGRGLPPRAVRRGRLKAEIRRLFEAHEGKRDTDEGSEYTSAAFRVACERLSICQSMGRAGSALDNAMIESWHSTVEFELRRAEHFPARAAARAGVAAWIDDYNRQRRHSALGMRSPVDYEQALARRQAA